MRHAPRLTYAGTLGAGSGGAARRGRRACSTAGGASADSQASAGRRAGPVGAARRRLSASTYLERPRRANNFAWQASAQALSLGMDAGHRRRSNSNALAAEGFAIIGRRALEIAVRRRSRRARQPATGSSAARHSARTHDWLRIPRAPPDCALLQHRAHPLLRARCAGDSGRGDRPPVPGAAAGHRGGATGAADADSPAARDQPGTARRWCR